MVRGDRWRGGGRWMGGREEGGQSTDMIIIFNFQIVLDFFLIVLFPPILLPHGCLNSKCERKSFLNLKGNFCLSKCINFLH